MSNIGKKNSQPGYKEAVSWLIPEIEGPVINHQDTPERRIELDDVHQFESRIKQQMERIRQRQQRPTYLTVEQIEEIQKQAYDEAFKQGYDEAYQKGIADSEAFLQENLQQEKKQLEDKARQLQNCFNSLARPLEEFDHQLEQQLTDLVFYFCRELLSYDLKYNPEHIQHILQQAMNYLPVSKADITVKMNIDDIALLEANGIRLSDQDWIIEADENMHPGSCHVDNKISSVDIQFEKRLKELTTQLYAGLSAPAEEKISVQDSIDHSFSVSTTDNSDTSGPGISGVNKEQTQTNQDQASNLTTDTPKPAAGFIQPSSSSLPGADDALNAALDALAPEADNPDESG